MRLALAAAVRWRRVGLRRGLVGALFHGLYVTGLGWHTGLTPRWHWVRRLPAPNRDFAERGRYRDYRARVPGQPRMPFGPLARPK